MRIGDFSSFKPEITSEGVKIGRFSSYSIPKTLKKHFDAVKEVSHTMKNLGRSKVRPVAQEGVALGRSDLEKLQRAHLKGGKHPESQQVKEVMLKLPLSRQQALTLLEAGSLEDAVQGFSYDSHMSPKLVAQMRKTWFEDPVQAASAQIFNKTPQQISSVSPHEISALKEMVSHFSLEQIKFFRKAQIQALPLQYLTDKQLQALTPKQKSYLLPDQIEKLTPARRDFLA